MHTAELQAEVFERIDTWAAELPPPLDRAWLELRARLRLDEGRGYFLHPLALPVLQLPAWLARSHPAVAARGEEAVLDAAEAAAVGYLHVRIQDDLQDEGIGGGAEQRMLSEALATRHHRLALGLGGSSAAYCRLHEARWLGYAGAMALEASLDAPLDQLDPALFDRLLQRTGPLVLPPAALAAPAWPDALAPLDRLVAHLARSHQLFTDAVDVEKDLCSGNPTWVQVRMGLGQGAAAMRKRLYAQGGLDELVAEARAELHLALDVGRELGLPGLEPWTRAREAVMEQTRQQVFARFFEALFSSSTHVVD